MTLLKRFLTLREASIIVVTVLTIVYFSVKVDHFFGFQNVKNILPYFAPIAILAAGEVFLMINGEIDLSIGGVYLLIPFLFYEIVNGGIPLLPALILSLIIAALIGVVNAFFTAIVGVNSFIVTLGSLLTLEGLALIISHGEQQQTPGTSVTSVSTFASVFGAGTYSELVWALVIIGLLQVVLIRSRWGLYTIAVGSNRIAAAEAGVRTKVVLFRNFILCSTLAGLVGCLEAIRTSSLSPDTAGASGIVLTAIAAAVVGGTLLAGGEGTVVGALLGALFLGVLQDGLAIQGVNANYLDFYVGLAIIVAMSLSVLVTRFRKGQGLG